MRLQISRSLLFLPVLFLVGAFAASLRIGTSEQASSHQPQESIKENIKQQYPVADSEEILPSDSKERTKRQKRSKRYNAKAPVIGPHLVQTSEGHSWPADFKAIPTGASDVVVVGTICSNRAHMSEDKNSVYSEFAVRIDQVLKNDTNLTLITGELLTITRKGGRVRYPSGHISWFFVAGEGLPQLNTQYVLFLKTTDEERLFDVLTGYAIVSNRIEPLDYSPGVVGFQRYSGASATEFVNEVRNSSSHAKP